MQTKKTTVMVVEDESIVALDIEVSLMELGYDVVAKTGSGKDAVALARKHRPDIILMDIMLSSHEDGVHAAGQITSQLDIPVVFLTAYSDKQTLDRVKLTEPFGYITKPYKSIDLSTAIELALYKHQQLKVLKGNRSWLDKTLKSIGDPLITTDKNCNVTFLNIAAQTLTGWSEDEIIGKPVSQIFNLRDSVTLKEMPCPVRQAVESENPVSLEGRFLLIRKDGATLPVGDCVAPIRDEDGIVQGAVLIFQDMTWHEKADLRAKSFVEELKRSNKELSSFTATASHDLQEPLRKVIAFGNLLKQSDHPLDEQQKDYLERMQNATRRMQKFTEDLLNYSRLNTAKEQSLKPVDLGSVVAEILSDLEIRRQQTGANVELGILPVIEADRLRMGQLFLNLIGNALKFHKKNGAPHIVKINSLRNADGYWEITIEDNGVGFDEAQLERIFKPFERLCGHSEYEGNGIGLAICWKIVENLGGRITAKSRPGEGSTFSVILPEKQNKKSGPIH